MNSKFYLTRILIVAFTVIGGMVLPNVNIVLQLTGSIGGTLIGIVVPFMLYHKAYEVAREQEQNKYTKQPNKVRDISSYIMLIFGSIIGLVGFINTI